MLRVQLAHASLGAIVLRETDPRGLDELEQEVKRSEENDGVMHEITISLDWTKDGKAFVKSGYDNYGGIQCVMFVNIFELNKNTRKWESYYQGQIDYTKYKVSSRIVVAPIQQIGFQRTLLNLMDTDFDVETTKSHAGGAIPITPSETITMHPRVILKEYLASPVDENEFQQLGAFTFDFPSGGGDFDRVQTLFGQINTEDVTRQELTDTFTSPFGFAETRFERYRATDAGTCDIHIKARLKFKIVASKTGGSDIDVIAPCSSSGVLSDRFCRLQFRHENADGDTIDQFEIGTFTSFEGCGGTGVDPTTFEGDFDEVEYTELGRVINIGDKIHVNILFNLTGTYTKAALTAANSIVHDMYVTADKENTFINFKTATTAPESTANVFFLHDAFRKAVQYLTGQTNSFYSTLLGKTDEYESDGQAAMLTITKGAFIRNITSKLFLNLDEMAKNTSALYCAGMGFETRDDIPVVVFEKKEYFYNKNQMILELGCVEDLEKSVSMKRYYSQVEIGFPKIEAEALNGIDETNTVRKFTAPLTQATQKLSLKSSYPSAGSEIEGLRRLIGATTDNKNDEKTYFVMLRRDGEDFVTARNQDYDTVTNVYDPASAYNIDLMPSRLFRNWGQILAAPLWANSDKSYKFSGGENNFLAETKKTGEFETIVEDADVDLTGVEPLFYPEEYSFKHPLTSAEFKLIKASPYGFIRFKDELDNICDGFILSIKNKPMEGMGDFRLLRVYRNIQ